MFGELDQCGSILAEYIWIGGSGSDLRGKTKTLVGLTLEEAMRPGNLPVWNFDGSSTGQAVTDNSEVLLRPRAVFRDPFRKGDNVLVLCDCYDKDDVPLVGNTRCQAVEVFDQYKEEHPWYGLEQEYTLFERDGVTPLGWPKNGFPEPQGKYYCGVGANYMYGRRIVEDHCRACLYAGVKLSGLNAEVMGAQWEFQVGPCEGVEAGDHLWMARYILERVCEMHNVLVSFHPKPMRGDWNGAGCHTNFSTQEMRSQGGYDKILAAIDKLKKRHLEHMGLYGLHNEMRLLGSHETSSYDTFTYGVADRGASVRIPVMVEREKRGYFEDRRPASNADPYLVTSKILETIMD